MYINLNLTKKLLKIQNYTIAQYENNIIIYDIDRNYYITNEEIIFNEVFDSNLTIYQYLIQHSKTPLDLKLDLIERLKSKVGNKFEVLTNNEMDTFTNINIPINLAYFYGLKSIKHIKLHCIQEFKNYDEFMNDKNDKIFVYGCFDIEKNKIDFSSFFKSKESILLVFNDFNYQKLKYNLVYLKFKIEDLI